MEEGVVYPNMDFILSLTPTDETASYLLEILPVLMPPLVAPTAQ